MTERFHWDLSGLKKAEFQALANALLLQTGRQTEESSRFDSQNFAIDTDVSSQASDDTVQNEFLSDSSPEKLKRKFLDRFSEFVSKEKGAKNVSCVVMAEGEDDVMLWVTKNEGFTEEDENNLKVLEHLIPETYLAKSKGMRAPVSLRFFPIGLFTQMRALGHIECSGSICSNTTNHIFMIRISLS